jgi:transmembrane sensor
MENKVQIEKLIKKFYLGTLTSEEISVLLDYLKDKEPKLELLGFYQNVWDEAEEANIDIDSKRIYNHVFEEINILEGGRLPVNSSSEESITKDHLSILLRYAAVFILAFALSWLVHLYLWNRPETQVMADQIQTIEVPYGSKSCIILPDGSVVTLNSGSNLKYSSSGFNSGSRSVALIGEGFFNVTKDSLKPFYVTTPGIKVKVLGTTLNVKAYPDENTEETTLVSGKAEIYSISDKPEKEKPIVLKPNQKAVFLKSENHFLTSNKTIVSPESTPVKLKTVNLQSYSKTEQTISWKENRLIFDNESFSSLVIRIERWYNVKIFVNNPELNSARFTGKFDKETLEQVLNALVTVTPFKYSIKQNLITISKI